VRCSHNIELAHLAEERKKERRRRRKHFGHFAAFWFGTFMMVFCASRGLVGRENT